MHGGKRVIDSHPSVYYYLNSFFFQVECLHAAELISHYGREKLDTQLNPVRLLLH